MKIISVVGTRPNFMKVAPLVNEFSSRNIDHVLVHTGQHYDKEMSELFFDQLDMPKPDVNLGVSAGNSHQQFSEIMLTFSEVLKEQKPDLVVVVGDVTSTLACAFAASQQSIPVAHVEAGLRSNDLSMPEEVNRILTDRISTLLFTTEKQADDNLKQEHVSGTVHFVGNVMIDTLLKHKEKAESIDARSEIGINVENYGLVTLHRPSNVDTKEDLERTVAMIKAVQEYDCVVLPLHPRTKNSLEKHGLMVELKSLMNVIITKPLGYLEFLHLIVHSRFVLTDSGGIQEETTVLGVPCITYRENTERPVTVEQGTNQLVSTDNEKVVETVRSIIDGNAKKGSVPELWDGQAAKRIVDEIEKNQKA